MQVGDFYLNYSSVGDIATIAICIINWFLLSSTYAEKKDNLKLFNLANAICIGAACCSIMFHKFLQLQFDGYIVWAYLSGKTMYLLQILLYAVLVYYLANIANIEGKQRKIVDSVVFGGYILYFVLQATSYWTHMGFYFDEKGVIHQNYFMDIHTYAYLGYTIVIVGIVKLKSNHFVTKVRHCLENVVLLGYLIMVIQIPFDQTSFTCLTYTFPIIAGLFLFHYNSYDLETGTLDKNSFLAYINDIKRRDFILVCMHLRNAPEKKFKNLSQYFFHFNEQFFKDTCTFRISSTTMILVYPLDRNPDHLNRYPELLRQFGALYDIYKMEYKLSFIKSDSRIADGEQYLELAMAMESHMEWNTNRWSTEKDIENFIRTIAIRAEIRNIFEKGNLDDERVKVFCQPVLNCKLNQFTTAEALMRMELPELGMLFPDEFIPIAEQNDYIHVLSMIILNKTCKNIVQLEKKGFFIQRVSVNFSMVELRDENFCDDILAIISDTGVEPDRIAIELTESRNEQDRELVKTVMGRLQKCGIKFYLDDFGTGYSNFEKLMGLPIDIVKFDRSLTIMSGKDKQSKFMVDRFADIFANSGYQILFEGIEEVEDEKRCMEMKAEYLQGYKYSKPIPIEELENFLEKQK